MPRNSERTVVLYKLLEARDASFRTMLLGELSHDGHDR
jgi:hypothetical protein